jgi:hypothetical protein
MRTDAPAGLGCQRTACAGIAVAIQIKDNDRARTEEGHIAAAETLLMTVSQTIANRLD